MIFGWGLADPIASVVVAALILRSEYKVSRDSLHILMEGKPKDISLEEVIATLKKDDIKTVHDVHLWTITSHFNILTSHIDVDGNKKVYDRDDLLHALEESLDH